jgi:SAM-dependent methyltransferase
VAERFRHRRVRRTIAQIETLYDSIGVGYTEVRGEDPRIAARIHAALGDARSVVNVGAGTGSYEPGDRTVTAVEPSVVMRAQRPADAAPVIDASAEALPFPDDAFDAAMAVLSDHHWRDHDRGVDELGRVACRRVVLFTWDPGTVWESWLVRDYLPAFTRLIAEGYTPERTLDRLGGRGRIEPVPIPHDCRDGFLHAYWRRPDAYLDPRVRAGISAFAKLDAPDVETAMARLASDLATGAWHRRHQELLELDELDLGYRLVVAEWGTGA